jgi:hypothetical protein
VTRSSVVTPIPTVTGPSNVSGPNESAANGSFKPPRLVGRLGQETVDATEQSVPVPTATPRATRKPRAPTGTGMWRGGPPRPLSGRVAGSSQAPRRLLPEDAEPRWLLLGSRRAGLYVPRVSALRLRGQGIRRHNRHIVLYSPFVSRLWPDSFYDPRSLSLALTDAGRAQNWNDGR